MTGESFATAAGGKGANQALAARRAGATVKMAGAAGDDTFAAPALTLLREAGTDLSLVKTAPGPTGTAMILIGEGGENMISVIPAANGEVSTADAAKAVAEMSAGDILMLQFEVPAPAIEAALTAAKAKRITTVINTAPLTADGPRLAGLADIVIANETEFELLIGKSGLSGSERENEIKALHDKTGQTLIVTLGADGVVAIRNGKIFKASGLKIEPVDNRWRWRYLLRLSCREPRSGDGFRKGAEARRCGRLTRLYARRRPAFHSGCRRSGRQHLTVLAVKCE